MARVSPCSNCGIQEHPDDQSRAGGRAVSRVRLLVRRSSEEDAQQPVPMVSSLSRHLGSRSLLAELIGTSIECSDMTTSLFEPSLVRALRAPQRPRAVTRFAADDQPVGRCGQPPACRVATSVAVVGHPAHFTVTICRAGQPGHSLCDVSSKLNLPQD